MASCGNRSGLAANDHEYATHNGISWKWISKGCDPSIHIREARHDSGFRLRGWIQGEGCEPYNPYRWSRSQRWIRAEKPKSSRQRLCLNLATGAFHYNGVEMGNQATQGKGYEPYDLLARLDLAAFNLCAQPRWSGWLKCNRTRCFATSLVVVTIGASLSWHVHNANGLLATSFM